MSGKGGAVVAAIEAEIDKHVVYSCLMAQECGMVSGAGAQKVYFGAVLFVAVLFVAVLFVATDGDETPAMCEVGDQAMSGLRWGMAEILRRLPEALQSPGPAPGGREP